jgi:hypothetical protein
LDGLPPPQHGALRVAFGQESGLPPERFLVGLAALTLPSRAAEAQPLVELGTQTWARNKNAIMRGAS